MPDQPLYNPRLVRLVNNGRLVIRYLYLAVVLLAISGVTPATRAALAADAPAVVQLHNHVPKLPPTATPVAQATNADAVSIEITVILNRTDEAGFQTYLKAVQNPKSHAASRGFVSQPQLTSRFGPSQTAYDAVLAFLKQQGFTLVSGSANRLTLTVRGPRSAIASTFGVKLRDYQLSNGRQFYAPDSDPSVPSALAPYVRSVVGLSTLPQWRRASSGKANTAAIPPDAPTPNPMSLAAAYDFSGVRTLNGAVATGAGQTVGLVEFDTIQPSDFQTWLQFEQQHGWLTEVHAAAMAAQLGFVPVDGGTLPSGQGGESEVLLDAATVLGMAPGARALVFDAPLAPGLFTTSGFIDEVQAMGTSGVTQISNSWGDCELAFSLAELDGLESVLESATASGVSFFSASGDSEFFCQEGLGEIGPAFPASAPAAIAVGGTTLHAPGNVYSVESFWDGNEAPPLLDGGGFGISLGWTAPPWQVPFLHGATTFRSVPDVVADADSATGIALTCPQGELGCATGLNGGTSMAAPEWAAGAALLEQVYGPLGDFDAALYDPGMTEAFHSPSHMANSSGYNSQFGPTNDFFRVGLGSFDLGRMETAVAAVYQLQAPPPAASPIQQLTQPQRVVDTRASSGPIISGSSRCFVVAGQAGIPSDAAAVVVNVTAVGYGAHGWLTLYPNGQAVPATSTLNFDPSEYAIANGTIMRIGSGGQVCVNVGTVDSVPGASQVILDATGFLPASAAADLPLLSSPQRIVDTRSAAGLIATGTSRCFQVGGVQGIPANAAAVVLNVTAVGYGARGWVTLYPSGQGVPTTSTLNFDPSEYAVANGTIMPIGSGGQVCANVGTVNSAPGGSQVIFDATGYLTSTALGQISMLSSPQRVTDTRTSGGPIATGQSRCFQMAGVLGIPSNATSVILNLTAVGYGTRGWLTGYPSGQAVPSTSTLNFDTGEYAMANGAIMRLGSGGQLCVNVGTVDSAPGTSQVIVDVVGYSTS